MSSGLFLPPGCWRSVSNWSGPDHQIIWVGVQPHFLTTLLWFGFLLNSSHRPLNRLFLPRVKWALIGCRVWQTFSSGFKMPTHLVVVFVLVDSFLFSHRLVLVRIKRFVDNAYDENCVQNTFIPQRISIFQYACLMNCGRWLHSHKPHSVYSTFLCLGKIFIGNKRDIAEGRIPELNTYMKVRHTCSHSTTCN